MAGLCGGSLCSVLRYAPDTTCGRPLLSLSQKPQFGQTSLSKEIYFHWLRYGRNLFCNYCYLCPVKTFVRILVVYFGILSVFPCTDLVEMSDTFECSGLVHTDEGHGQEDHEDTCPPFCSCNCCGVTVVCVEDTDFVFEKQELNSSYFFSYSFSYSFSYESVVWRPPISC